MRKPWPVLLRLVICALLLFWICHTIFVSEAQSSWAGGDRPWAGLTRGEQWHAAWTVGPEQLWRTLTLVRLDALLLSLVFMGLTVVLGVWRWRLVMRVQGLELPWGRALSISLVAQFFNAFLLGSTGGDLMKAYCAARETHRKTEAVMAVFADRLIGLFSMLLFAGAMMLLNLSFLLDHAAFRTLVWALVAMLGACALVVVLAFWGGVSLAWPSARAWLRRLPKGDVLEQAVNACRLFGRDPGALVRAFLMSALLNAVCVAQVWTLGWGLGLEVPALVWLAVVPVVICVSALPITPSGLGVRENLYVLVLAGSTFDVSATQALSVSLLAYFGFVAWSLVGGVVYIALRQRGDLQTVAVAGDAPLS